LLRKGAESAAPFGLKIDQGSSPLRYAASDVYTQLSRETAIAVQ